MDQKKCQNCGADISLDTSFCPYCGAGQQQAQPQQPQQPQQGQPYAAPQQPYANPQDPYAQQGQPYAQQGQPYGQPYGQPPVGQPMPMPGYVPKSKLAAGLLGIFLGGLGIHNFYLGYKNKALIQLLVGIIGGVITCGVATLAMEIWGLVEGIMILTGSIAVDANGVPLRD